MPWPLNDLSLQRLIPEHLKPYLVVQDYEAYSAMDHAAWRFIMQVNHAFFKTHAHPIYVDGLRKTGIPLTHIPKISDMDHCLQQFGWRAVPILGFIPPGIFMEFFSLKVLPIACDMRKLENLSYTPAPDIVHEAAGHAPILADPQYAAYLQQYGTIARRTIFHHEDLSVYEAICNLSELKESPDPKPEDIAQAQEKLRSVYESLGNDISEATELARMSWWTFEYGLIGDLSKPLIYGAGLLSSLHESYHCLTPSVKKVPFSQACTQQSYDITRPQPQLYVAKDFKELQDTLAQFSTRLERERQGTQGLKKLLRAQTVNTAVLDSGLQISGKLIEVRWHNEAPCFLRFEGPVQLCYQDQEIKGQSRAKHPHGYSTPLGPLENNQKFETLLGLPLGSSVMLDYASGISLRGKLQQTQTYQGTLLLITLDPCEVRLGDQLLFDPSWGAFDLACADKVTHVFGGPADPSAYHLNVSKPEKRERFQKRNLSHNLTALNERYEYLLTLISQPTASASQGERAIDNYHFIRNHYPNDWLYAYLLYTWLIENHPNHPVVAEIENLLSEKGRWNSQIEELMTRALTEISHHKSPI